MFRVVCVLFCVLTRRQPPREGLDLVGHFLPDARARYHCAHASVLQFDVPPLGKDPNARHLVGHGRDDRRDRAYDRIRQRHRHGLKMLLGVLLNGVPEKLRCHLLDVRL